MRHISSVSLISLVLAAHVNADPANSETPVIVKPGAALVTANPLAVILGLMAIVGLILVLGWLLRRLNGVAAFNGRSMKVVAAMSVGPRERVMLIDVAGTQILIGVAAGSVNALHHFESPVITPPETPSADFQKKFQQLLGRGRSK